MATHPTLEAAIGDFLRVVESPPDDPPSRLRALAMALDGLAAAYHSIGEIEPIPDDGEPPARDHAGAYRRLASSFPEFGLYTTIDPDAAGQARFDDIMTGDAVSDLEEIAGDLSEIVALLRCSEQANAEWQFKFSFESHWGRHLRDLQGYLHHLIHEARVTLST